MTDIHLGRATPILILVRCFFFWLATVFVVLRRMVPAPQFCRASYSMSGHSFDQVYINKMLTGQPTNFYYCLHRPGFPHSSSSFFAFILRKGRSVLASLRHLLPGKLRSIVNLILPDNSSNVCFM